MFATTNKMRKQRGELHFNVNSPTLVEQKIWTLSDLLANM